MGLFRTPRDTQANNRFFYPKVILFAIGGGVGLAGMLSGRDWMVVIAIIVLGIGVVLRFLGRRDP